MQPILRISALFIALLSIVHFAVPAAAAHPSGVMIVPGALSPDARAAVGQSGLDGGVCQNAGCGWWYCSQYNASGCQATIRQAWRYENCTSDAVEVRIGSSHVRTAAQLGIPDLTGFTPEFYAGFESFFSATNWIAHSRYLGVLGWYAEPDTCEIPANWWKCPQPSPCDPNAIQLFLISAPVPGVYIIQPGESMEFALEIAGFREFFAVDFYAGTEITILPYSQHYLEVSVHGQVPEALLGSWPSEPAWNAQFRSEVVRLGQSVNEARRAAGLVPIEVATLSGDWSVETGLGTPAILESRWAYAVGSILPTAFQSLLYSHGASRESEGKAMTRVASRSAARRMASYIATEIKSRRRFQPDDVPLHVDIVAHSRGATIASESVRLLYEDQYRLVPSQARLITPTSFSITYLDAIDPSGADLARPNALAGKLLEDPEVLRHANETVSSFSAQFALLGGVATPSWFPTSFTDLLQSIGITLDESLVSFGYPRGRSRPELLPVSMLQIPQSSHGSIVDSYVEDLATLSINSAPYATFSFANTSSLGALVQNPLADVSRHRMGTERRDAKFIDSSMAEELVYDGGFVAAAENQARAASILAIPEIEQYLQGETGESVGANLGRAASGQLPNSGGVWTGWAQLLQHHGSPAMWMEWQGVIRQFLREAAAERELYRARVVIEFLNESGSCKVELGADGVYAESIVDAATIGVGKPVTVVLDAQQESCQTPIRPVYIEILGRDVLVRFVSVVGGDVMIGDVNRDRVVDFLDLNAVLSGFGRPATAEFGDDNCDGVIDFLDLNRVLSNYGRAGPEL